MLLHILLPRTLENHHKFHFMLNLILLMRCLLHVSSLRHTLWIRNVLHTDMLHWSPCQVCCTPFLQGQQGCDSYAGLFALEGQAQTEVTDIVRDVMLGLGMHGCRYYKRQNMKEQWQINAGPVKLGKCCLEKRGEEVVREQVQWALSKPSDNS